MSNSYIWPIDRTLSGTTTPGQSGPESNSKEKVLHIPQSSRAGALSSDYLMSYQDIRWGGVLHLYRDIVGVLFSSYWLGSKNEKYTRTR